METNQKAVVLISLTAVQKAKDNRMFYTATFQDASNPFAKDTKRNFWQQFNSKTGEPEWRGADPIKVKAFLNKSLPGYVATREVVPYSITSARPGEDPITREINTYTTVVLGHEVEGAVFRSLGHALADSATVPAGQITANADIMAADEPEIA